MESWKPHRRSTFEDTTVAGRPHLAFALPGLAVAAMIGVAATTPPLLILPVISLACVVIALGAALFAWRTRAGRHSSSITSWDVAGAFAFIGFAAAMLSKPENVAYTFAGIAAG